MAKIVSPPARPWDIDCSGDVKITKQEFRDECDVNIIVARCVKSGLPLPSAVVEPLYADVSQIGTYDECVRRVEAGRVAFMQLPAKVRTEFDNDPGKLIAFLGDVATPENRARAISLGLIDKPMDPEPDPVVPAPIVPAVK